MKKISLAAATAIALAAWCAPDAQATTLSGNMTVDNFFFAFISTSDATLGTQVASGNNWPTTVGIPATTLTPGVTNYLHIEAINQTGPAMFIGDFSLSDTGFTFANGTQSLSTDTTDWRGGFNDF